MGGLVTCHHLACVGEDGGGEEAEGVDTWYKKKKKKKEIGGSEGGETENGNQSVRSSYMRVNRVGGKDQRDTGLSFKKIRTHK